MSVNDLLNVWTAYAYEYSQFLRLFRTTVDRIDNYTNNTIFLFVYTVFSIIKK